MTSVFVWTIGDVVYLIVGSILLIAFVAISVASALKQYFCKHDGGVGETSACDAICRKCGKNLGFIGNLRDRGVMK